jgi:hypothetical protein
MFGSLKESSMFDKKFESDSGPSVMSLGFFIFCESFGNLLNGWVHKAEQRKKNCVEFEGDYVE